MASPLVAASPAAVQEVVVLCAASRVAVGAPHHRDVSAGLGWREREGRVSGAVPTSCSGTVAAAARWEGVALACRSAARVTCLGGWKKRVRMWTRGWVCSVW